MDERRRVRGRNGACGIVTPKRSVVAAMDRTGFFFVFAFSAFTIHTHIALSATLCDQLAASPEDDDRAPDVPGIRFDKIDATRAIAACKDAAQQEPSPRAYFQLGRSYGSANYDKEAFDAYWIAANKGYTPAEYNLAVIYDEGKGSQFDHGTRNDADKAEFWYLKAAKKGFWRAQYGLGLWYKARGYQSHGPAEYWLKLAADRGHADAQYNLGIMYTDEQLHGNNPEYLLKARQYLQLSANQGHAFAQNNLGLLCESGKGGPIDTVKARDLFEQAAAGGSTMGMYNLGRFYKAGAGGLKQDRAKAQQLYQKAADSGNQLAQENLALMLQENENARKELIKQNDDAVLENGQVYFCQGTSERISITFTYSLQQRLVRAVLGGISPCEAYWKDGYAGPTNRSSHICLDLIFNGEDPNGQTKETVTSDREKLSFSNTATSGDSIGFKQSFELIYNTGYLLMDHQPFAHCQKVN